MQKKVTFAVILFFQRGWIWQYMHAWVYKWIKNHLSALNTWSAKNIFKYRLHCALFFHIENFKLLIFGMSSFLENTRPRVRRNLISKMVSKRFQKYFLSRATSMLATDIGDKIRWRQLWDVGDGFERFCYQYLLALASFSISVGHQHPKDVTNIEIRSPTSENCHQHPLLINFRSSIYEKGETKSIIDFVQMVLGRDPIYSGLIWTFTDGQ